MDPRSAGHVGYSDAEARRGDRDETDFGTNRRASFFAAIGTVAVLVAAAVFLLARGGERSDESAIRAWFASPAGGGAPSVAANAIHVEDCDYIDATSGSRQVLNCALSTDAPNPPLHACFVIADGNVLRGGWQLSTVDVCRALRFDRVSGMLVDPPAHARYYVLAR